MWLAIDISELHATVEKYTYSFLSRSRSRSIALLEAPPIPRGKSNDECHDEFKMLGIKVSAILETRLLIWIFHIYVAFIQVSSRLKCWEINVPLILTRLGRNLRAL